MLKKFSAVLLAVVLVLSLSVVSFAADEPNPTHMMLLEAADSVHFEYDGLNERSDRVFYLSSVDNAYHVIYFANLARNSGGTFTSDHFYSSKLVDGHFVHESSYHQEGSSVFCIHISNISDLYSEKEYKLDGFTIPANITEVYVSRHLSNIVYSNDFSQIWQTIKPLLPVVIPCVVFFLAFRKGWSFLKGEVASA